MKKVIAALTMVLASTSFTVHAVSDKQLMCDYNTSNAGEIMKMRQQGVPRDIVQAIVVTDLTQLLLDEAYNSPIVPKDERQKFIADFKQTHKNLCEEAIKSLKEKEIAGIRT